MKERIVIDKVSKQGPVSVAPRKRPGALPPARVHGPAWKPFLRGCLWGYLTWCTLAAGAPACFAEEPAREFLLGLRARGYFDTALEYLEQATSSPVVSEDFKQIVLYEKGVTLIQGSRYQRDPSQREQQLNEAQAALKQFSQTHKNHHLVSSANNQLANLLVERARVQLVRANDRSTGGSEKNRLVGQARNLFDQAHDLFVQSLKHLENELDKIPPRLDPDHPQQKQLIPLREQYRADQLQARMLLPKIDEERADTFPEGSKQRNELLQSAATQYKKAYEDYRTRIAGLYARMNQGRCYVKLKDYGEALSYFSELLEQPDQPEEFLRLKKETLILAVDCWLNVDDDKKLYNDAILRLGGLLNGLRDSETREPDWLYLRLALAKAYKAYADDVTDNKEKTTALNNAKNHATFVSRVDSQYQREAKQFLAEMRGDTLAPEVEKEPETFAEARKAGKDALDEWQSLRDKIAGLQQRLAKEQDAQKKAELQKQLKDSEQLFHSQSSKSLNHFRLALELADEETLLDDLNVVRYFLGFWYFNLGDYYDAALIGEFVARRYPGSPGASQCAQIAIASYLRLYKENPSEDKPFETDRIISIGDYMIETWPDQQEAVVAANTLIAFMITDQKLDKAVEYLNRIPVKSPQRGPAELSTGQALWGYYLQAMNQLRQEGELKGTLDQDELARLKEVQKQAEQILDDGIQRMSSGYMDESLLRAIVSLAQLYVEKGDAVAAIKLLEDEKTGPLPRVEKKDLQARDEGLVIETYRTALRAYIGSLSTNVDKKTTFAKARAMMAALKQSMGSTPDGLKRLVVTYITLASEIKQQLESAPANERKTVASGFAEFLREVRAGADELTVHIWAADSFSKLGDNFRDKNGQLTADANHYYDDAITSFQGILQNAQSQSDWLPDDVRIQVQIQMATTFRKAEKFKEAIDVFEEILQEKNSLLNVQVEAAMTLKKWGDQTQQENYYRHSMTGDRRDQRQQIDGARNKNYDRFTIWGWGKLSKITANYYKQYKDIFHESRLNLAQCRFEIAKLRSSSSDRKTWLENAKNDITYIQRLYPDLGGQKWWSKYDQLMKEIQQTLNEPAVGLEQPVSAGGSGQ